MESDAPVEHAEVVEGNMSHEDENEVELEENVDVEEKELEENVNLEDEETGVDSFCLEEEQELTDEERVQLYDKGMRFKMKQSYKHALLCFLGCIKGIQQDTKFSFLPNCLQNIASIYAKFEDFPKAVQFMQAAKLYYETALIGTQADEEEESYKTMDDNAVESDAKRANEYEKLSHDCLLEKNVPLALEYCGKATQLRRKVYGENHPVTIKSLDLFTMIYAEMGKMQYSDAVKKLDEQIREDVKEPIVKKKVRFEDEKSSTDEASEKGNAGAKHISDERHNEEKFAETEAEGELKYPSSKFFSSKQMIIIFLISSLFAIISTFVYCNYTEYEACPSYDYLFERAKFHYYYYIKSFFTDNNYI